MMLKAPFDLDTVQPTPIDPPTMQRVTIIQNAPEGFTWEIQSPNRHDYGATYTTLTGEHHYHLRQDAIHDAIEHAMPRQWVFGYTPYAVDTDRGEHLCLDCARAEGYDALGNDDTWDAPWYVTTMDDPATDYDIHCDNCHTLIDAVYTEE